MRVLPVTPERWPDPVELFEQRGPRGGHRNTPANGCWCMYRRDRTPAHDEPKKRAMAKLVRTGCEPGLLLDKPEQRRGVAGALLDAAVEHAFAHGAAAVEAYPHAFKGDDYMGGVELYGRAGFAKLRDANKRVIVRIGR